VPPHPPQHLIEGCLAFHNAASGFYANHHPVPGYWISNTGYDNHPDFDMAGVDGPRQADGSLPCLDFLRPKAGGLLVDRGTDAGLPFLGAAPDLGAHESGASCVAAAGDAGVPPGSSSEDSGPRDAQGGPPGVDAGTEGEAGEATAGGSGSPQAPGPEESRGCQCDEGGAGGGKVGAWAGMAIVGLWGRRRGRKSRRA